MYDNFTLDGVNNTDPNFNTYGAYTYSKSIDDTSGIRVQGYDTLFPQNGDCIDCERGLSAFDTRHRLVTSAVYDLPVGKGRALNIANGLADAVICGRQAGGIWTMQSGLPQVITIGGVDRSGTGNGYDRPNATLAGNGYLAGPTPSRWDDPGAFVDAPAGTYGNVGGNTLVGPGIMGLDFDAHKEFRLPFKEGHRLQLRFEAFNVLNHPVWAAENGHILAGAAFAGQPGTNAHQGFGVVSGTAIAMRQLQFGAEVLVLIVAALEVDEAVNSVKQQPRRGHHREYRPPPGYRQQYALRRCVNGVPERRVHGPRQFFVVNFEAADPVQERDQGRASPSKQPVLRPQAFSDPLREVPQHLISHLMAES
jgi:hypothetical protein